MTSLYLFGSTARDEAGPNSDLDIFIEHAAGFRLLELVGVKQAIEDGIGIDTHVTTRDSLRPELRAAIEHDAVRVF